MNSTYSRTEICLYFSFKIVLIEDVLQSIIDIFQSLVDNCSFSINIATSISVT